MRFSDLASDLGISRIWHTAGSDQSTAVRGSMFAIIVVIVALFAASALAQTLTVLHSFNGKDGAYRFSPYFSII
jgi:hypothetical protein